MPSLNEDMIAAASDRKWGRVRQLIEQGADVNFSNSTGEDAGKTAFWFAASFNDRETLRYLMQQPNFNPNSIAQTGDRKGISAFWYFIYYNSSDRTTILWLLENGINNENVNAYPYDRPGYNAALQLLDKAPSIADFFGEVDTDTSTSLTGLINNMIINHGLNPDSLVTAGYNAGKSLLSLSFSKGYYLLATKLLDYIAVMPAQRKNTVIHSVVLDGAFAKAGTFWIAASKATDNPAFWNLADKLLEQEIDFESFPSGGASGLVYAIGANKLSVALKILCKYADKHGVEAARQYLASQEPKLNENVAIILLRLVNLPYELVNAALGTHETIEKLQQFAQSTIVQALLEYDRSLIKSIFTSDELDDSVRCPLGMQLIIRPVQLQSHAYEKNSIDKWLKAGNTTDPLSREPIPADSSQHVVEIEQKIVEHIHNVARANTKTSEVRPKPC